MKKVLLLGASGSIGRQSLDIIEKYNDRFLLTSFSVGKHFECIDEILKKHKHVKHIYLIDKDEAIKFKKKYPNIRFYHGEKGLKKITKIAECDMVIDALVGFSGLIPALISLKRNKILCLANKEALVVGGKIINNLLARGKGKLYPIDSEHVAIAKCLSNVDIKNVDKIIITASGGALRDYSLEQLKDVTPQIALSHPTWKMGNKITIDCATMMNKGFEVIEAYYLFGFDLDKIEVLLHDESLIHSAIKLNDGSYILDYGKPDMHNPIEWALFEGKNEYSVTKVNSLKDLKECHYREYDKNRYPLLELAKTVLKEKDVAKMVAMNASNEVMVNRFLSGDISYTDIAKIVFSVVNSTENNYNPSLRKILRIDHRSRKEAFKL